MSKRFTAFAAPAPEGWIPQVGDRVYTRSGMVCVATVVMVLTSDVFKVRYQYGGRTWLRQVGIADVLHL